MSDSQGKSNGSYEISDVRGVLDRIGVCPEKSMGQNFLTDSAVAESIVMALDAGQEDVVVEIGPGLGALTKHLAGKVKRLILVEFDPRLAAFLSDYYKSNEAVVICHADATKFDLRPLFQYGPIKLIGNLPYSCAGEIMRRFLDPPTPVVKAVLMLQKEVADRLVAHPRTKAYGRLTLLTRVNWKTEELFVLPADPFYPKPNVESTVLRLIIRSKHEFYPFDRVLFDRLLRCGFAQRRKQLKKRLPIGNRNWSDLCEELDITITARAEELDLEDWLAMARLLDNHPLKDHPQSDAEMFDVVDADNVVTGQKSRGEIHALDLLHRAVHVFVFNALGELYLQKRSVLKDCAAGLWGSSASGHIDAGESYQDAARREMLEELGVDAQLEKILDIDACKETGWEFVSLFITQNGGPFVSPCSEVETGVFMPVDQVSEWVEKRPQDFSSGFLGCWESFIALDQKV